MFSFLCKNIIPFNPKMREYCIKSTDDSIINMNKKKFDNLVVITKDDSPNPNPNDNIILSIICLLSSTTLFYYFYKDSR